ncbi:MAG TPA: tape measure protein [Candidatus Bathyarchaeia archaeon]|nr:tape measure protein [Candidatus Bathyarchaeia archaeon]
MATVTGTIKMFDAMSGPLKRITQSMNIMVSSMQQMQNVADKNMRVDKSLATAKQQIALAEAEITSAIAKSTQEQNKFNKSSSGGGFSLGKIVGHVFAINEGLELMSQLWGSITSAMDRADEILGVHSRLTFVNDGLQTQYQMQQKILKSANDTRASYRDTSDTIAKLGLFAPNLFKSTDKLISFTETLNKLFVASGAGTVDRQVALQQLGQALSSGVLQGDELRSISEAAPLFMDQLAKGIGVARGQLKGMGADGKLTAEVVVKAIEKQAKSIDKLFQTMPMTFGGAFTIMGNKFDDWIGKMYEAGGPLRDLTGQMEKMIAWMNSERGAKFFEGMTVALKVLIATIGVFSAIMGTALNVIIDYWPEISAMLLAVGAYYLPAIITKLWAMVPPATAFAVRMLAANWPILVIMAAVFALIAVLRMFGVTTDQIVGFVTGLFYGMFAFLNNQIAVFWNMMLALGEFMTNLFIDPVYAIQKLFYDMLKNVSDYFLNFVNSTVEALNWLISKINEVSGTSIAAMQKMNASWVEGFKPEKSNKNVVDLSKYRMEQMNVNDAFNTGSKWGVNTFKKMTGAPAAQFGPALPNQNLGNIAKVGEVGKIKDTVDISSEDLKIMRELAEMKNIQNFVTLTPTVQVTGDNHYSNGYDIDTVISRINKGLEEEIASSARMALNV